MKSPLRTLSRETAIYGVSTVVGRFLNFLLVPFYVNVLRTRAEYGLSSSLYAYVAFLSVVFPLGLEGAYFRYAARAEGEPENLARERRLFSTPLWLIAAFGALAAGAIVLLAPDIAVPLLSDRAHDLSPISPVLVEIVREGALILLFDACAVIPFASLRLEHRAAAFAGVKIANIALTLALNFWFVLRLRWGIAGIFRANALASAATLAAVLWLCRARIRPVFEKAAARRMLPFGLNNVPAYLGAMMVQVIDRPIVQRMKGLDALAVYQANYRMGFAMMVFVSIFDYAWRPFFLRQHATHGERARETFARVFTYTTLLLASAFLVLSFFLPWFVGVRLPVVHRSLLRPDYLSGTGIIPIVLLAYVFQGFFTNFIAGIYIREKTKWLPFVTGLGALVNVVTNFWWIPIFGIAGAAAATLAAYVVMAAAIGMIALRIYPVRYEWGRLLRIAVLAAAAFIAGRAAGSGPGEFAAVAAFFVGLFLTGFFSKDELQLLRRAGRSQPAVAPTSPEELLPRP